MRGLARNSTIQGKRIGLADKLPIFEFSSHAGWLMASPVNDRTGVIRVVADDRENAGGAIEVLQSMPEVRLTVRRLPAGDFLVEENFLIERKTLRDFAASVIDARLFKQAAALATGTHRGVVVLEGTPAAAAELGVSRESLQGALITVSVFYGLAVLRTRDATETARLLVYLGRQARHCVRGALRRASYRPKGKRARQLFMLQGLPGVGPERAARLLDHFGSVKNVAQAPAGELTVSMVSARLPPKKSAGCWRSPARPRPGP
jgi:DNA excision repair protein ERCC-4